MTTPFPALAFHSDPAGFAGIAHRLSFILAGEYYSGRAEAAYRFLAIHAFLDAHRVLVA